MSAQQRKAFYNSIRPFQASTNLHAMASSTTNQSTAARRAEAEAAREDGYELIDSHSLSQELRTKAMIEDLVSGMDPLVVGSKHDVYMSEMIKRIARYAYLQGKATGEFK